MEIITLPVGELQANCYIITKENKTILIDPGDEFEKILKKCQNKNIVAIYITHHHFDHIGALEKLERFYHIKHNEYKDSEIEMISTKGHSKDSISLYFKKEKILFSGDFIFQNGIGRWDLKGGNLKELRESIQKILKFPKETIIYPGHGPKTTLQEEETFLKKFI